jgi:hypothetical protein
MTEDPVRLDGHRTSTEQREVERRRHLAKGGQTPAKQPQEHQARLETELRKEPAGTWIQLMEKWRYLLERYAATSDADNDRIQKLIRRAIGDLERMKKREDRK